MNQTLVPSRFAPPEITDFSQRHIEHYRYTLLDASVFILAREGEKSRLMARVIAIILEQGSALETAFQLCLEHNVVWEKWVSENLPRDRFSIDTVGNYRNLWKRFRAILLSTEDAVKNRMNLGALYTLATETATDEMRQNFINALIQFPELKGDEKLAVIARDIEVNARFQRHELNLEQAYGLALALPKCLENVAQLARDKKVQYAEVVEFLDKHFRSFVNTPDEKRPDKTWADLEVHDFVLSWKDDKGTEREVPIGDANHDTCEAYMLYRWKNKRQGNGTVQRATAKVIRQADGSILLQLQDMTAFPEGFNADEIVVDLRFKGASESFGE